MIHKARSRLPLRLFQAGTLSLFLFAQSVLAAIAQTTHYVDVNSANPTPPYTN
jgi:preprotein translocase subunit SecY